jgi:subtilisin family serine protease
VVDGMPDAEHEALASKLATPVGDELLFAADRTVSSHATQIAGIVAGESSSFTGAAPGVRLLPLIVNLNSQVYAERASALRFAAECARRRRIGELAIERLVLACSWRTSGDTAVVRTALGEAVESGILVVCSAGNGDSSAAHYPSAYSAGPGVLADGVLAVAATDRDDVKASYSNYAASVDLCAPGGDGLPIDARDIPCTEQGSAYGYAAGTSMAVPHVAAVAALMLSVDASLTPKELKRLLRATADPIAAANPGLAGLLGAGRLNARGAVAAVADAVPGQGNGAPAGTASPPRSGPTVSITVRRGPRVTITTG